MARVHAHALRRQGWTISAIARHLGRDRKTIRAYLNGERATGQRRQAPDAFVPFLPYCRQCLADDPHLWASILFDVVVGLGYEGAYSTFTRALRRYRVRPHCSEHRLTVTNHRDSQVTERSRSSSLPIASRNTSCCGPSLNCSSLSRQRRRTT